MLFEVVAFILYYPDYVAAILLYIYIQWRLYIRVLFMPFGTVLRVYKQFQFVLKLSWPFELSWCWFCDFWFIAVWCKLHLSFAPCCIIAMCIWSFEPSCSVGLGCINPFCLHHLYTTFASLVIELHLFMCTCICTVLVMCIYTLLVFRSRFRFVVHDLLLYSSSWVEPKIHWAWPRISLCNLIDTRPYEIHGDACESLLGTSSL